MDNRIQFISEWMRGDLDISKLCRKYGVSRPTGYKWIERYEREGASGLEERSHEAKSHPNALAPAMEALIVRARGKHPNWGPKKLVKWIERTHGFLRVCAPSTAGEVLKRAGLSVARRRARRNVPWEKGLGRYDGCNTIWCVDHKGWFRLGNGQRCDPFTVTDGFSRYLLRCQAFARIELAGTRRVLEAAFREFGLPERIRSDNGAPFGSVALGGLSSFAVWLMKLGITPERIQPGCPYQNGRHERMHLTLDEAVRKPAHDLRGQQRRFDAFKRCFNTERPHEALGQETPASVYQRSLREYTGRLEQPHYESSMSIRRVQSRGEIKWKGGEVFLSETLRGEHVGMEEVTEGVWAIYFMNMELGRLDERTMQIEPKLKARKPKNRTTGRE